MRFLFLFIPIFLITGILFWFIADALIWMEFLLRAYTPLGQTIAIWMTHIVTTGAAYIMSFAVTAIFIDRR